MSVVIAKGKTKIVKTNPYDPETVFLNFKDDITADDGVKHDVIEGKAVLDWAVSRDCFELLGRRGLETHYVESPAEGITLVRKLDRKLELEVVTRRVATGSILNWGDSSEGERFDPLITQFHYKDDPLHDPMLDGKYVEFLIRDKDAWEYDATRKANARTFLLMESCLQTTSGRAIGISSTSSAQSCTRRSTRSCPSISDSCLRPGYRDLQRTRRVAYFRTRALSDYLR